MFIKNNNSLIFMKELIKKEILRDLIRSRRWGGKHTEIRNLKKGLSTYLLNTKAGKRAFEKAVKELINNGWLLAKKSAGEIHVSLSPHYSKEIVRYAKT